MKGNDGVLGQDVPDLDVVLDFCRCELSRDKSTGQRKFRTVAGVKQEVPIEQQMRRHYHKVTQRDIDAEDAPECTEDSALQHILKVHQWVPDRAGRGRHRQLLCSCDHCIEEDYNSCERAGIPQFSLSAPHDVVPETGSVRVTRADAEAKLADEAEIALGCITIGTTVSIDMHDASALVPFHVLLVTSLPYTLTADQFSPILTHLDGSPLPMCKGDVVFNAVFYQPVGETGLRFELWDQAWWKKGGEGKRLKKGFQAWEGCPNVVVPGSLIRHWGFNLERERQVPKAGARYALSHQEDENIRSSLTSR